MTDTRVIEALTRLAAEAGRAAIALERIADKLDAVTDDDRGELLRVEVVPR